MTATDGGEEAGHLFPVAAMVDTVRRRLARLARRVYPRLGLRPTDVLLASYPKSGNTWVRFIWANTVSLIELEGQEVDFHALNRAFGADYDSHDYGTLEFECLPRLVKTHRPYDGRAFGGNRTVYLYRHPGDVMVSYHRYLSSRETGEPVPDELSAFLRSERYGLPAWNRHVAGWREEADAVIRYGALHENAAGVVAGLLERLGVEGIQSSAVEEAAERSRFDRLRGMEEERGRPRADEFEEGHRFMRKGRVGEWRERLTSTDREYLRRTVEEHGLADLVDPGRGGSG